MDQVLEQAIALSNVVVIFHHRSRSTTMAANVDMGVAPQVEPDPWAVAVASEGAENPQPQQKKDEFSKPENYEQTEFDLRPDDHDLPDAIVLELEGGAKFKDWRTMPKQDKQRQTSALMRIVMYDQLMEQPEDKEGRWVLFQDIFERVRSAYTNEQGKVTNKAMACKNTVLCGLLLLCWKWHLQWKAVLDDTTGQMNNYFRHRENWRPAVEKMRQHMECIGKSYGHFWHNVGIAFRLRFPSGRCTAEEFIDFLKNYNETLFHNAPSFTTEAFEEVWTSAKWRFGWNKRKIAWAFSCMYKFSKELYHHFHPSRNDTEGIWERVEPDSEEMNDHTHWELELPDDGDFKSWIDSQAEWKHATISSLENDLKNKDKVDWATDWQNASKNSQDDKKPEDPASQTGEPASKRQKGEEWEKPKGPWKDNNSQWQNWGSSSSSGHYQGSNTQIPQTPWRNNEWSNPKGSYNNNTKGNSGSKGNWSSGPADRIGGF